MPRPKRNADTPAPAATIPSSDPLLAEVLARLDKLERASRTIAPQVPPLAPVDDADQYWILNRLRQSTAKAGEVVYAGAATLPTGEQYIWQRHAAVGTLMKTDWSSLDRVIAALGHPVRLRLLKLIVEGKRTKAELEQLDGLGTTGQLYHHLNILQEAGWVRSLERGSYSVPGERVVPLLAILSAAAG